MSAAKIDLLQRSPLFAGLDPPELAELARLAVEKRYEAGQILFTEGEDCEGLFLIAAGSVKIFKSSPGGREMTISIERAPATVAELPLFDGGPYPASVAAIDDTQALIVHKRDFRALCLRYPAVALKVLAVVGRRLRHLVLMIESMTFGSVRQRLARLLLEAADRSGGETIALDMTQQEIASRLGTVREVVSRNLARFQNEGLVAGSGKHLRIVNRAGLEQEAETEI